METAGATRRCGASAPIPRPVCPPAGVQRRTRQRQQLTLANYTERMVAVDYRLTFGRPLCRTRTRKNLLPWPTGSNLGVQVFDFGLGGLGISPLIEDSGQVLHRLLLPRHNLVGMHIELLRQLRQCLVASQRGQRHPGLELRGMIASGSFQRHLHGRQSAHPTDDFYHLSTCPEIPDHLCVTADTALDLAKELRTPAKLRMNLKATYDLDHAHKRRDVALAVSLLRSRRPRPKSRRMSSASEAGFYWSRQSWRLSRRV